MADTLLLIICAILLFAGYWRTYGFDKKNKQLKKKSSFYNPMEDWTREDFLYGGEHEDFGDQ